MVISGGHFKPDALKPKEVVSLLLDDAEMENKFLQKQAEQEQAKRRRNKRKKTSDQTPVLPLPDVIMCTLTSFLGVRSRRL
eukprot:m.66004 g.66004  ORF g.66004 m.66004 type:complete len:81 (+) comp35354_c0_seq4:4260-4502(+)